MQFTPQEMKLIERLRKKERFWPRTRWVLLGMVVFFLTALCYMAYFLFHTLDSETFSPADSALVFAIVCSKFYLMIGVTVVFLGLAIRDWHGNVHRMLLLRLLDAQQKESARDEKVG